MSDSSEDNPHIGSVFPDAVLDQLQSDERGLIACLTGVKHVQDGELHEVRGDFEAAVVENKRGREQFLRIPQARILVGIACFKAARICGGLQRVEEARKFAEDALAIIEGVDRLEYETAGAHTTLGSAVSFRQARMKSTASL